jgi:hypothetical protein
MKTTTQKIILAIIVLLASIQFSKAQYGFIKGYVITNTNDTLYGEIKDRNAIPNILFERIKFKPENGGKKTSYSATQIKGYKKGDDCFESISCFLDTAVFVKVVRDGFLSLYKYEYQSFENSSGYGCTFLLKKQDSPCVLELSATDFKKQLLDYFNDSNLVKNRIKEKDVSTDQLADIVSIYNQDHLK